MSLGSDHSSSHHNSTVLVVEDEVLIAMDLEAMLTQRGWRVISAATVQGALRLLEIERPDVALLDVNIGGEMVTPVAAALKKLDVPFVLSSAYDEMELQRVNLLVGALYVKKPVSQQRLYSVLAEASRRT